MLPRSGGGIGCSSECIAGALRVVGSLSNVDGGVVKTDCTDGRDDAARCVRLMKLWSSNSLALDCSGLMTRYASLEKKRTFWPVPGVLLGFRMERIELNLSPFALASVGVLGARKLSMDGRWESCD